VTLKLATEGSKACNRKVGAPQPCESRRPRFRPVQVSGDGFEIVLNPAHRKS